MNKQKEIDRLLSENTETLEAVSLSIQTGGKITGTQIMRDACSELGAVDSFQVFAAIDFLIQNGIVEKVDSLGAFAQNNVYKWI